MLDLSVLITTHHALFFNILYNGLKNNRKKNTMIILKTNDDGYNVEPQSDDSIFSYHIAVISEIKEAIKNDNIQKKHFNLMRSLSEKTSCFLGYSEWQTLFNDYSKNKEYIKMLNSNSHGKYSETEMTSLTKDQTDLFEEGFNWFLNEYHFKNK